MAAENNDEEMRAAQEEDGLPFVLVADMERARTHLHAFYEQPGDGMFGAEPPVCSDECLQAAHQVGWTLDGLYHRWKIHHDDQCVASYLQGDWNGALGTSPDPTPVHIFSFKRNAANIGCLHGIAFPANTDWRAVLKLMFEHAHDKAHLEHVFQHGPMPPTEIDIQAFHRVFWTIDERVRVLVGVGELPGLVAPSDEEARQTIEAQYNHIHFVDEVARLEQLPRLMVEWERDLLHAASHFKAHYHTLTSDRERRDHVIAVAKVHPEWVDMLDVIVHMVEIESSITLVSRYVHECNPSREQLVRCHAVLRDFDRRILMALIPELPNWPCDADMRFVVEILRCYPSDVDTRKQILEHIFLVKVPLAPLRGYDARAFTTFFMPVVNLLTTDEARACVLNALIDTWVMISAGVISLLGACVADNALLRSAVVQCAQRHDKMVMFAEVRAKIRPAVREPVLEDVACEVDAEGHAPDSACIYCCTRKRALCFTPCGHIVSCHACFAQLRERAGAGVPKCPTCRVHVDKAVACYFA